MRPGVGNRTQNYIKQPTGSRINVKFFRVIFFKVISSFVAIAWICQVVAALNGKKDCAVQACVFVGFRERLGRFVYKSAYSLPGPKRL